MNGSPTDPTLLGLPAVEAVDELPTEALPPLALALAALQSRVAARLLLADGASTPPSADRLLTIEQAAEILCVTKDWLRHRPTLPFVVKVSEGVVRYSEQGLARFIRLHMTEK